MRIAATFVKDDGSLRHLWIRLTLREWVTYYVSFFVPLVVPKYRTWAEAMGPELESLVCGGTPERYSDRKPIFRSIVQWFSENT